MGSVRLASNLANRVERTELKGCQSPATNHVRFSLSPCLRALIRHTGKSDTHGANGARVVIISQELARRYFSPNDPVGQSLAVDNGAGAAHAYRVVGVVGDLKDKTLADVPKPMMYFLYTQEPWWVM